MSDSHSTPLPLYVSAYGYKPTLYVCAIFIALFGLSTIIHIAQAIRSRIWWLFPTAVLAGTAEVLGWVGRLWSSENVSLLQPFLIQITTTIIAPTPFVAANFVMLGIMIGALGRQYSRLSPKWYTIVFCSFDITALVVQAVGGASASQAAEQHRDASKGGHIMLGGIAFQLATIMIYVVCAAEFFLRFLWDRPLLAPVPPSPEDGTRLARVPTRTSHTVSDSGGASMEKRLMQSNWAPRPELTSRDRQMIFGLALSTLFVFIRSVYRVIELSDGWGGRIITTEVYFNVLDGAMITLAMFTLNIFHPGRLLAKV